MAQYTRYKKSVHRLIPSRLPPISVFDWVDSAEELEIIANLESATNGRLRHEIGDIHLIPKNDWVLGASSTPIMAAFTHPGISRFSDGRFGIYYAAGTVETAIAETKFHRERFLSASKESPCLIQLREYICDVKPQLLDMRFSEYQKYLSKDLANYHISQQFGCEMKAQNIVGMLYPSVRKENGNCFAIFKPNALTIPQQSRHFEYIWDGEIISEINLVKPIDIL